MLTDLIRYIRMDNGLRNSISDQHFDAGIAAARRLTDLLEDAIARTGVNADGLIDADDVRRLASNIQNRPADRAAWREAHGQDGGTESGFHLLRGDGGSQLFRNTGYVDRVADAIFSIGFGVSGGRVLDEQGQPGATLDEVAGWLNFFANGRTAVYGTSAGETLYHSRYDTDYADAESEIYFAGAGSDSVWGGAGHDIINLGAGDDRADGGSGRDLMRGGDGSDVISGGTGNDRIYGGAGRDTIGSGPGEDRVYGGGGDDTLVSSEGSDTVFGGAGDDQLESWWKADTLFGGDGADQLYGGTGRDLMYGGAGRDRLYGEGGNDRMYGGSADDTLWGYAGDDRIYGGGSADLFYAMEGNDAVYGGRGRDHLGGQEGHDRLFGGSAVDTLWGQEGRDVYVGGRGADQIMMWENSAAADRLVFRPGDSGMAAGTFDRVEGFGAGDRIDLRAFGDLRFRADDFRGDGIVSAYYDGRFLRIDSDGNGRGDMRIEFAWTSDLTASDFIL